MRVSSAARSLQRAWVWGMGMGYGHGHGHGRGRSCVPPMVGSLFSWKSLLTKRMTSDDLPTAASPSSTSLTLLLGFGCADASAIASM